MVGWGGLIKQCGWDAKLQEDSPFEKSKGGRPKKEETAPHRGAVIDPTLSEANRHPKDRKSRLIRTLVNLKADPEACKAKGTNTEKVGAALSRLVRGLTSSVEAAKREAGLAASKKPSAGLGVRGAADDVAKRLIRMVGADHAKRIAHAVLEALGND